MSAVAGKRINVNNIFKAIREVFGTGVDVKDDFKEFNEDQQKALDNIDKRAEEVEKGFNFTANSSKNGGNSLKAKYETPKVKSIDENSKENLKRMTKILKGEKAADKDIEL